MTSTMSHDCLCTVKTMVSLLGGAIFLRRQMVATALNSLRQSSRRGIIDGPLEDILLHKLDFPKLEHDYLTVVSKKWFQDKYGSGKISTIYSPSVPDMPKRLTAVLPLELEDGAVIPLPMIIDTGAPGMLYLGSKPLSVLNKLGLIKDVVLSDVFHYRVRGKLTYGFATISEVYASEVPSIFEAIGSEVRGDIRCNILGLPGIVMLELMLIREVS